MWIVLIHEQDGSHNIIGPFWHRDAASIFVDSYIPEDLEPQIIETVDRDKWTHG